MATSEWNAINIRGSEIDAFPGTTGQATAIFHGAIGCVNSSGFAEDYSSTSKPKILGIVDMVNGNASSTGDVITTQGSINQGINLVKMHTGGRVDSVPFDGNLGADDAGKAAFAIDNFTLTADPGASTNMSRVGTVTKYYTASKGEVRWEGYSRDGLLEKATVLTTSSSSIMMSIANPLGVDVVIDKFQLVVTTASSSAHAVSVGIATTSTGVGTDIVATGAIALGTTGVYGTAKTTNFFGSIYWGATKYLTLSSSSGVGDGGDVGTLVGYIRYTYKPVIG